MLKGSLALLVSFLLILSVSGQTLLIDDPLNNGKTSGKVVQVDADDPVPTFNEEGWQPGASVKNQNHILYEVPFSFGDGFIEFEIKGMQNPINVDSDPAFCGLYDGSGIEEPIQYFDDFKKNHYRWNIHFRGDKNVIKCKIQMPAFREEIVAGNKAVFPSDPDGSYSGSAGCLAEPDGQLQLWSKTAWYKIKIEWKAKKYTVYVNDSVKWQTELTCDYTPGNLRIWLGCAPGDTKTGKYTASVDGMTYRNFKVYAYK